MNQPKKTRFVITCMAFLSVIAARAADLSTTLHFNPSLSREANPFVSVLGFDANQLIFSNVIGVLIFVFAPLLVYLRCGPSQMQEKPQSLSEYVSLQLYRCRLSKSRLFSGLFLGWPFPKDYQQVIRAFGFAISWTVVFAGLQQTFAWWATNEWGMDWYQNYRGWFNFRGYPIIELIPVMIVFLLAGYLFFRMEFKVKALEELKAEQDVAPQSAIR